MAHGAMLLHYTNRNLIKHWGQWISAINTIKYTFVIIAMTAVATDITTREGYQSILTCVASGDPQPVISWYKAGESNTSTLSSRHAVYGNGSLVISDTNRSDSGNYVCRGSNAGGEDQATISLNASLFLTILQ